MRTVKGPTGATYSDSLALYNNALETQGFYDNKAPYYNISDIDNVPSKVISDIESGKISQKTIQSIANAFWGGGSSSTSRAELDKLMQDPQMRNAPWVQGLDKVYKIMDNKDPDIQLISDVITGAIDPYAPLVAYNRNIKPQGFKQYNRKDQWLDLAGDFQSYDISTANNLSTAYNLINSANKNVEKFDDLADSITVNYSTGDGNKLTGKSGVIKKSDVLPTLKAIKDATGLSEKEIIDRIIKTQELVKETALNTPGNSTMIPYYDPVMVKPYKDLTPSEQQERIQKSIDSGNTGGLPPSVVAEVEKKRQTPKAQVTKTKQSKPKPLAKMQSIPASEIEQIMSQNRKPSIAVNAEQSRTQRPGRSPRAIMRQDPTVSKGQYQVGELYWDNDKKKWQRDMWDKDERRQSRKEATPRRERWRTIRAPKF